MVARDYRECGEIAARLSLRIMQGESPANIPFTPLGRSSLIISKGNSAKYGLQLPPALLKRADKVVE